MSDTSGLYLLRTDAVSDPAVFERLLASLPPQRREKALRFKREEDRHHSAAASALLVHALTTAGVAAEDLSFSYGEQEKPYLDNHAVSFNLSHAGNAALCAVLPPGREIGCDIEVIGKPVLMIAKRYFCEEERNMLFAIPDPQQQARVFYRLWTIKESVLKALGCGLSVPLNSFNISFETNRIPVHLPDPASHCITTPEAAQVHAGTPEAVPVHAGIPEAAPRHVDSPENQAVLFYREYDAGTDYCCSCSAFLAADLPEKITPVSIDELIG